MLLSGQGLVLEVWTSAPIAFSDSMAWTLALGHTLNSTYFLGILLFLLLGTFIHFKPLFCFLFSLILC